jgi:chromate reductase
MGAILMSIPIHILGISGSLRKNSFNTGALRAAGQLLPEGVTLDSFDLSPIPLYNEDVRAGGFPDPVQQFREKIAVSDALLVVSPEYNFSIPGPLKNAIDWASRPPSQPFDGKPIAIMGAASGAVGTARGQQHLRQVFVSLNGLMLNKPQVMIASASAKFDDRGNLIDEGTKEHIQKMLIALADWARRLKPSA